MQGQLEPSPLTTLVHTDAVEEVQRAGRAEAGGPGEG